VGNEAQAQATPKEKMIEWTPELDAELLAWRSHGWAFRVIAPKLSELAGAEITTNACIGRHGRLKARNGKVMAPRRKARPLPPPKIQPKVTLGKVTLQELNSSTCRWPVTSGWPPYLFCGATPLDGLPYCAHHADMGYTTRGGR